MYILERMSVFQVAIDSEINADTRCQTIVSVYPERQALPLLLQNRLRRPLQPRKRQLALPLCRPVPAKPTTGSTCTSSHFRSLFFSQYTYIGAYHSGDSYSQTGFNDTSTLPNAANPIGNPPFPGYSATGGANWVGYLTATNNKSLIYTYNYAYGGATIDATLVAPYETTVLSVTDQVNEFLGTVASKPASTPWTSANALFSVWIGVNDIGNSYYASGDRGAYGGFHSLSPACSDDVVQY
jgi:hypothetical protein